MSRLKWLFILIFLLFGGMSFAADKPIPKRLDDLTFDDTLYTSDDVDTLLEDVGPGGGSGFPLTNNVSFASWGASNVNYIGLTTNPPAGHSVPDSPPDNALYLGGDGTMLYFNGEPVGSGGGGGGAGTLNIWGPVAETNQKSYVTNTTPIFGIKPAVEDANMSVVYDERNSTFVLRAYSAIPGPPGPAGPGNILWYGSYEPGMIITNENTWVSYNGSIFVWTGPIGEQPVDDTPGQKDSQWKVIISKGQDGKAIGGIAYTSDMEFVQWTDDLEVITTNMLLSYGGWLFRVDQELPNSVYTNIPVPVDQGALQKPYITVVARGADGAQMQVYTNAMFVRYFDQNTSIPAHSLVVYNGYLWYANADYIPGESSPPSDGDPNWECIGRQGIQGPAGANGIGNLIYVGHYDQLKEYHRDEIVGYTRPDGKLDWYRCLETCRGADPGKDVSGNFWTKEITSGADADVTYWTFIDGNYDFTRSHSNELYRSSNGKVYYSAGIIDAGEGNAPPPGDNATGLWRLFVQDGTSVAQNTRWRGEYTRGEIYYVGDMVTYEDQGGKGLYICDQDYPTDGSSVNIRPTNPMYWTVVANGLRGYQGPKGDDGGITYITNIVRYFSDHIDEITITNITYGTNFITYETNILNIATQEVYATYVSNNYTNWFTTNIVNVTNIGTNVTVFTYETNYYNVTNYTTNVFETNYITYTTNTYIDYDATSVKNPNTGDVIPELYFDSSQFRYDPLLMQYSIAADLLGVSTLNGLSGDVGLEAGNGITITTNKTPTITNIVITATGGGGMSSLPLGRTINGTIDEYEIVDDVDKLIFDSSTGFRLKQNSSDDWVVSLGSSWTTLFTDDGQSFGPNGEEPLRITTHTNDTQTKWEGYVDVVTTNEGVVTTNHMRVLSIGVGSTPGGHGGGANLDYYGDWIEFAYSSNSLVRYGTNIWFNAENISEERKTIPPSSENPDWEVFLKDGSQGEPGQPGETIYPFAYAEQVSHDYSGDLVTNELVGNTNYFYFKIPEGEQGIQGEPGAGLHPRGNYSESAEYNQYDIVRYEEPNYYGQYYVWTDSDNPISGIAPTNTYYWRLFVKDAEGVSINSTLIRKDNIDYPGTLNLDTNTLTILDDEGNKFLSVIGGGGGGSDGRLPFDITVSYPVGKYKNNDTITNGTEFSTIFRNMLIKQLSPTYPSFTVTPKSFGISINELIEYGSQISSSSYIDLTYAKNNGGNVTNFSWMLNNSEISSSSTIPASLTGIASDFNSILATATEKLTASFTVKYAAGPDLGPDYTPSRVVASSITKSFTMTPARYRYYAPLTEIDNEITEADVKALPSKTNGKKELIASNTGSFTIDCQVGTAEVIFALPLFFAPKKPGSELPIIKAVFQSKSFPIPSDVTEKLTYTEILVTPENSSSGTQNLNKYGVMIFKPLDALEGEATLTITY